MNYDKMTYEQITKAQARKMHEQGLYSPEQGKSQFDVVETASRHSCRQRIR